MIVTVTRKKSKRRVIPSLLVLLPMLICRLVGTLVYDARSISLVAKTSTLLLRSAPPSVRRLFLARLLTPPLFRLSLRRHSQRRMRPRAAQTKPPHRGPSSRKPTQSKSLRSPRNPRTSSPRIPPRPSQRLQMGKARKSPPRSDLLLLLEEALPVPRRLLSGMF